MMKPRPLTESEVTFTADLQPEDMPYEGHFSDARDVAFIRKRLEADQQEAWCCISVIATWNGIRGTAHLGGVSLDCGQHPSGEKVGRAADEMAREHGMLEEALDDLNRKIAERFAELAPLLV